MVLRSQPLLWLLSVTSGSPRPAKARLFQVLEEVFDACDDVVAEHVGEAVDAHCGYPGERQKAIKPCPSQHVRYHRGIPLEEMWKSTVQRIRA